MIKKIVFLLLVAVPIFYSGLFKSGDINEQQLYVLLIGTAMLVAATHFNRIIGYSLFFLLFHIALFHRPAYMNSMIQIMAHFIIYDVVAKYYRSKNYKWAILFVLVANLIMASIQAAKQDVYVHINFQTPGLMTLGVYIGIYAAIIAPVLYSIHPILILAVVGGIVFSKSSFSAAACVAAMCFYLWHLKRKALWIVIPALCLSLGGWVVWNDFKTSDVGRRVHIWKMVASCIATNPWGGFGLGSYNTHLKFIEIGGGNYRRYLTYIPGRPDHAEGVASITEEVAINIWGRDKAKELYSLNSLSETQAWFRKNGSDIYTWQDPHNEYLLVWFELGFFGIILIAWYVFDMVMRFLQIRPVYYGCMGQRIVNQEYKDSVALFSAFLALLIVCIAHFPMTTPKISFMAITILALLDQKLPQRSTLTTKEIISENNG